MSFLWLWERSCEGEMVTSNIMDFSLLFFSPQAASDWKLGYCALVTIPFLSVTFFVLFFFSLSFLMP